MLIHFGYIERHANENKITLHSGNTHYCRFIVWSKSEYRRDNVAESKSVPLGLADAARDGRLADLEYEYAARHRDHLSTNPA